MILNEQFLNEISDDYQYEVRKSFEPEFSSEENYDIFISHSFLDQKLIRTLASLFQKEGFSVYIDWIQDPNLDRSHVTMQTAKLVKDRIGQCKSLAYIATENISNSKWCPWELGIGDGVHNGKACILPILKKDQKSFDGQEYLGLYPFIEYSSSAKTNERCFWVTDPKDDKKYTLLRDWLNDQSLTLHN